MPTSISDDDEQNDDDQDLGQDDAIEMLSDVYVEVQQIFVDHDSLVDDMANAAERESLASEICALLTTHAPIEEEIFYPDAQQVLHGEDLIDLALAEHAKAKQLMAEVEATSANEAGYDDRVRQLGEAINKHVREEEESLFVLVTNAGLGVRRVGRQLFDRREELLAELDVD